MDQSSAPVARAGAPVSVKDIQAQQNFALAAAAGIGAAIVGAIAWTIVTVVTKMELGLMAVAVGYIVGQAVRNTGKGIDQQFGILGAACALFGCALGNMLSAIAIFMQVRGIPLGNLIGGLSFDLALRLYTTMFQPMDVLFYGIAIYEGYRFSFRYKKMAKAAKA